MRAHLSSLALTIALGAPAAASPASFASLSKAYFAEEYAAHPTEATASGLHAGDALLDDVSAAAHTRDAARLHATLAALQALPAGALSPIEHHDRDVLAAEIGGQLLELETVQQWRHNPATYVDLATSGVYQIIERDFAPLPARLASAASRERQIPAMFAEARRNLTDMPPVYIEIALEEIDGTEGFLRHDVPAAFASVKDARQQAELAAAGQQALAALADYKAWLTGQKPLAHGRFEIGIDGLARLLAADMVTASPAEVLAAGRAQLARDQDAFRTAARAVDPKDPDGALAEIEADHPGAAQLIATARDGLAALQRFIADRHIVDLPAQTLPVVGETPPFSRALVFGELDPPGPFETRAVTAYYYITPPDAADPPAKQDRYLAYFNRPLLQNLSVHEALPGHFTQFLFSQAHPEWSDIRKTAHSYTVTEGWAHYSEQMMLDEGLGGGGAKLRLAQLQDALLRDCRLVASISMHTGAMTLPAAAEMMARQCFQPASVAYKEARRGTSDPGYFSYTLGKLEILKLRRDVQAAEGGAFSLARFHDRFLAAGLVPVAVIRREMTGHDGPAL